MSLLLFIRHGDTDAVGSCLAGRNPGVHLNERGRRQAEVVAERLATLPPQRVICSPLERTCQTAAAIAERFEVGVELDERIIEVDFGEWSGRSFDELENDPMWRAYHAFRSGIRIPGGEMATEIQARMVAATESIRRQSPESVVAIVSHGDPIRYALGFYMGIPVDLVLRLEVGVASVSAVTVADDGARIHMLNSTAGPLNIQ